MLGCTGFGGPVAHLAYFRTEFVARRAWLRDEAYADVVALCQFLPGPASSQVGMALGFIRAGVPGAIAAWMGFTVPSAVLLVLFAEWISHQRTPADSLWLHGLAVAIVAVLAQALWGMGRTLCPDRLRAGLAVTAAAAMAWIPGPLTQTICIVLGGLAGWRWGTPGEALPSGTFAVSLGKRTGLGLLCLYGGLLLLPILIGHRGGDAWRLFNTYYHVGALVFGGGHVVLSLLQTSVVPSGTISNEVFLAGYGAAQAVPGPLLTFAAYLGACASRPPNGLLGATIALVGIFLPSFFLVLGSLPLWGNIRQHAALRRAIPGMNAAVVGLLLATFYQPVWTSGIHGAPDFALAMLAFLLLLWRAPSWLVVLMCATAGFAGWH